MGNIDPDEVLRYFSWTRFAIVAAVYSAVVFWIEFAKDGPFIFSGKNKRSKAQVWLAHLIFLTILLCGYSMCTEVAPALPFWMTDTFQLRWGTRASLTDIVSCFVAFGMAFTERKWLYRELPNVSESPERVQPPSRF